MSALDDVIGIAENGSGIDISTERTISGAKQELLRLKRLATAYALSEAHLPNGLCGCCHGKIGSPWNSGPDRHNLGHETNCDVAIHLNLPKKNNVY